MSDLSDDDMADLDLLADLLAGEGTDEQVARVAASPELSQALADLSAASDLVVAELAALPDVSPPEAFDARLAAAFAAEPRPPARASSTPGGETVVPLSSARSSRTPSAHAERSRDGSSPWPLRVAAGVIGVALLGGVGVLLSQTTGSSDDGGSLATAALPAAAPTTASGRDYADARGLAAALPSLLASKQAADTAAVQERTAESAVGAGTSAGGGTTGVTSGGTSSLSAGTSTSGAAPLLPDAQPPAVAAPPPTDLTALDRLRTPAGLRACLDALELPAGSQPLLLDYASFKRQPALIILVPVAAQPTQVDAYVVGANCGVANEHLLLIGRLDRP